MHPMWIYKIDKKKNKKEQKKSSKKSPHKFRWFINSTLTMVRERRIINNFIITK